MHWRSGPTSLAAWCSASGWIDTCARALLSAAALIEDGGLDGTLAERYAGWNAPEAQAMLGSEIEAIAAMVEREGIDPQPRSGRQERLENLVNGFA